jgi:hypothetical protein
MKHVDIVNMGNLTEARATLIRAASVLRAMAATERKKRDEARRTRRDWAAMGHADRAAALEEGADAIMLLASQEAPPTCATVKEPRV